MELAVLNTQGKETGRKVVLSDAVFGVEANDHAIYLDVKQYLADQRQGTHKSKQRNEVAGSTRKLKRQKGTGGARCGSIKSPLFVGGGRVFGPVPRRLQLQAQQEAQAAGSPQRSYLQGTGRCDLRGGAYFDGRSQDQVDRSDGRGSEGCRQESPAGFAGFERQSPALVPQPPLRESHSGFERQYVRSDERFGAGDGRGCREYFEYNVSLNTRKKNGNYH